MNSKASTRERGNAGEDAAALFLESYGYRIVTRNWKPPREEGAPRGELDIIAWHENILCFIEVKALRGVNSQHVNPRNADARRPQENVTLAKQRQISRLSLFYLSLKNLTDETPCRFDVVEVWLNPSTQQSQCLLHQGAFGFRE